MDDTQVDMRLNQQQLELLDRTVREQQGSSRSDLAVRALNEYFETHFDS